MTLPNYNNGSGFYDPGKNYQSALSPQGGVNLQNVSNTGYQAYGTNDNPQGVYLSYLAKRGLGGLGSRAQAAQGMYGQVQKGYQAAKADNNFELMFPEYLDQARVEDIFNSQSYDQQGLDMGRYGQRPYRWSMRG